MMPISHHDDRNLLAELLAATRQLGERLGAAARHGFCCSVASRAAREARLHLALAQQSLGDGAAEMDRLPAGDPPVRRQEIPAVTGG